MFSRFPRWARGQNGNLEVVNRKQEAIYDFRLQFNPGSIGIIAPAPNWQNSKAPTSRCIRACSFAGRNFAESSINRGGLHFEIGSQIWKMWSSFGLEVILYSCRVRVNGVVLRFLRMPWLKCEMVFFFNFFHHNYCYVFLIKSKIVYKVCLCL